MALTKVSPDMFDAQVARYYRTSTQTINDNTNTAVEWNGEEFNTITAGMMNASTGRLTIGKLGYYEVYFSVGITSSISIVSGNRTANYIRKNGGSLKKIGGDTYEGSVTETKQWGGGDIILVDNVSDYFDFITYLDFGGVSYSVGSVNNGVTYLTIRRL